MQINADLSRRAVLAAGHEHWVASPQAGVERVMLDRAGGEPARATSIVRYAPGAGFPHHRHPGGEEILVLSGIFSEGGADYPAGWYLRNPPGSSHLPSSRDGAVIFVKLGQMRRDGQPAVRINTGDPARWQRRGRREVCPLFAHASEQVCLLRLAARTAPPDTAAGGMEILVLEGEVREAGQPYRAGSWIRLPAGARCGIAAGAQGATIYLKTGHLIGKERTCGQWTSSLPAVA